MGDFFLQHSLGFPVYTFDWTAGSLAGAMSVHLMNMEAGGETVLVTFAREGLEARAFNPVVDGKVVRFAVAGGGKMTDSATGSTWDALTGECLSGTMKGARLTERPDKVAYRRSRRVIKAD